MPRREIFVVVIVYDFQHPGRLKGRLRHVATNDEAVFNDGEELLRQIIAFLTRSASSRHDDPLSH